MVVLTLHDHGIDVVENVSCAAGAADLVTVRGDAIFEIKHRLTRRALCQAIGQVLLYRFCIRPNARAIIIGYATAEITNLLPLILALGIEVVCWKNRAEKDEGEGMKAKEKPGQNDTTASLASSFIPHPSSLPASALIRSPFALRWNIAALALAQGFSNATQLAARMHVARQSLYGPWRNEAAQISLDMLGRLARTLDADPGDWFSWITTAEEPALVWNIQGRMQALGLTTTQLGFRAELYSGSIIPIVDGIAQAVSLEALAKLAHALDTPEHPFSIGDLFVWEDRLGASNP